MISGTVVSIHLSPQAVERMMSVAEVRAVSGKGLEGDRYFNSSGTYSKRVGDRIEADELR